MALLSGNIQNKSSTEDWARLWDSARAGEAPGTVRSPCHLILKGRGEEQVSGAERELQQESHHHKVPAVGAEREQKDRQGSFQDLVMFCFLVLPWVWSCGFHV